MPPLNAVTDPVLLRHLAQSRIDTNEVRFVRDYSHRGNGKENSPYAKWYAHTDGRIKFAVFSGLPMVTADNDPIVPGWRLAGANYFAERTNLMAARIQGRDVELRCRNAQPDGRAQGATLSYSPQLFVGGVELPPASPVLIPIDPWNPHYQNNVLEWDYGVCKRKLRQVEGRVHGYWVFPANPGADVLIRYNQAGDYRLKLGQYRQNADEELIPAAVFASASYPFEVSDSATYYPDADPETTSVDGYVFRNGADHTWADLRDGAGTGSNDTGSQIYVAHQWTGSVDPMWYYLSRGIFLFDSSGLPNAAIVSAATLSLYGSDKIDQPGWLPNTNIYTSTPASNTALVAADYIQVGSVAQSTAITYAGWSTAGYNDFALNDLTKISLTGVSKFGARNANYDVANTAPTWTLANKQGYLLAYTAGQGAGFKPKLVVTYTAPTTAFFAFM